MNEEKANNNVRNRNQNNRKTDIKSIEYKKVAYIHVNFDFISSPPLPQVTLVSLQLQILLQLSYLVCLSTAEASFQIKHSLCAPLGPMVRVLRLNPSDEGRGECFIPMQLRSLYVLLVL